MMNRLLRYLGMLILLSLGLTACATSNNAPPADLPLAAEQPTFLFFYTDN